MLLCLSHVRPIQKQQRVICRAKNILIVMILEDICNIIFIKIHQNNWFNYGEILFLFFLGGKKEKRLKMPRALANFHIKHKNGE